MPETPDIHAEIKEAELEKIRRETAKLQEETLKAKSEREAFERAQNKPWFRKESFYKPVLGAIVGFPILWFFFSNIVFPVFQAENVRVKLENELARSRLYHDSLKLDRMKTVADSLVRDRDSMIAYAWKIQDSTKSAMENQIQSEKEKVQKIAMEFRHWTIQGKCAQAAPDASKQNLEKILGDLSSLGFNPNAKLTLEKFWLQGAGVKKYSTPKMRGDFKRPEPTAIVIHYTGGADLSMTIKAMSDPKIMASAHVLIGKDGEVAQLIPFDKIAWHAGVSSYAGRSGYNDFSIAVELDNAGKLEKRGDKYFSWFGREYPPEMVFKGIHKYETEEAYWHKYSEIQIRKTIEVCSLLVANYGIKEIIGHDDISPGRKTEPGPAFPMERVTRLIAKH